MFYDYRILMQMRHFAPELIVWGGRWYLRYNEEGAIAGVLEDWRRESERLQVDYGIHVYNDCSTDNTECVLREAAPKNPRVVVTNPHNLGHGGTVLRGYREVRSNWVFQVDGDNEITPAHFDALWPRRKAYDFLLGWQEHRPFAFGSSRHYVGGALDRALALWPTARCEWPLPPHPSFLFEASSSPYSPRRLCAACYLKRLGFQGAGFSSAGAVPHTYHRQRVHR
jgi:glycosyltransferase involved in cell wall biosynthesis